MMDKFLRDEQSIKKGTFYQADGSKNTLFVSFFSRLLKVKIGARMGHTSRGRGFELDMFGGEDQNSFALNDFWVICLIGEGN